MVYEKIKHFTPILKKKNIKKYSTDNFIINTF